MQKVVNLQERHYPRNSNVYINNQWFINLIPFFMFVELDSANKVRVWAAAGNPYWRGRLSTADLLVLTTLDLLIFMLKSWLTFVAKQVIFMRSTVLNLPVQLVFPCCSDIEREGRRYLRINSCHLILKQKIKYKNNWPGANPRRE